MQQTSFWFTSLLLFYMKGKELVAAVLVQHKKCVSFQETQILTCGASSVGAGDEGPLPQAWAGTGSII